MPLRLSGFARRLIILPALLAGLLPACVPPAQEGKSDPPATVVSARPPAEKVEAYDFAEIALVVQHPAKLNPFTEVTVRARFRRDGEEPLTVDGFCDAADGSSFKVRFMPSKPGRYRYKVTYR
jgi:hypothetical protein